MSEKDDYLRLGAVLVTAAMFGAIIAYPKAGRNYVEKIATIAAVHAPLSAKTCPSGQPPLSGPFAPIEDVLSLSPLGGVTVPGEPLPAPYLRINTRTGDTAFKRRVTTALAPGRADIVALERRVERDDDGHVSNQSWTVFFQPCKDIAFYYDRIDHIDDALLKRAGGISAFIELGGADHIARETTIRVRKGETIGSANGFDIGFHDLAAAPAAMGRPERYRTNPYASAAVFDAPPSLIHTITPDVRKARCAIDYLPENQRSQWGDKLGDAWGMRRSKGDNACRTAVTDIPGTAQGVWFTDASHNATTNKVSAIALSADSIDPKRLIFALHGRLPSLTADLIGLSPLLNEERTAASKDFLTFDTGPGRVNRPFGNVKDEQVYCYERLRTNFVGPLVNGVILLQKTRSSNGASILRIETRSDAYSCSKLPDPWTFTGNETTFYR